MNERKIVDYDVVAVPYCSDLVQEVKKLIKSGWHPYGDAILITDKVYYQSMVKYE